MDYKELRNYVLIIGKYRGFRHGGKEQLMRMMTPEQLDKKIRAIDAEAREIAKVILFKNRNINLDEKRIESEVRSTDIEFAKDFIKDMTNIDTEPIEIPDEIDY